MKMKNRWMTAAALIGMIAAAACQAESTPDTAAPNTANFTAGVNKYLARKGQFCFDYTWPVDVRSGDTTTRDATQMPVLEKLGLVKSANANVHDEAAASSGNSKVRRYTLTEEGKKYYSDRPIPRRLADGTMANRPRGLCAATLTLDKIVGWDTPHPAAPGSPALQTTVSYTYKIDTAPWAQSSDAQKVYAVLDRLVHGAGTMQLKEVFTLKDNTWVSSDAPE